MAVLNLKAYRVQQVLRRVHPCLLAHTESQPEGMVETTSTSVTIPRLGIEFDEAVLNLVVLDSAQKVGYDRFMEL